jgi:histone-lysine N-methyltransferase SETMAR
VDWVPEGQTVNQVYYKEVLTTLLERVRRRRPEMPKSGSWVLHQDNAPAHNALSVKTFLTKHMIIVLEHPSYSPDLAPCDFFLFPKIKSALKGTRFESVDAVKAKATVLVNKLSEDDLQHLFQQWKSHMERCRDGEGSTLRVTPFPFCNFLNKK